MQIVPLNSEYLNTLIEGRPDLIAAQLHRSYFSQGSIALCLLSEGVPVFAGGIVNLQWNRGEAWILPTPWFRSHLKTGLRFMRGCLPRMAVDGNFVRVQATCIEGVSAKLFRNLGFFYEGTLAKFGPHGETCRMYSRIFEVGT